MSLTFTETKTLADGNQIRITEAAAGAMTLAVKIGAGAVQPVTMTAAEAQFIQRAIQYLTLARSNDAA